MKNKEIGNILLMKDILKSTINQLLVYMSQIKYLIYQIKFLIGEKNRKT